MRVVFDGADWNRLRAHLLLGLRTDVVDINAPSAGNIPFYDVDPPEFGATFLPLPAVWVGVEAVS